MKQAIKEQLSDDEFVRYSRQIMLPDWALQGQLTLANSKVLIVGCGGLGTMVASQLGGAGVGHLVLVDDDEVELSNLPRQLAFDTDSVQNAKAFELANRLREQNPDIIIEPHVERFEDDNAAHFSQGCDLIIDCSDNFNTRYGVNRHGSDKSIAVLSGSVVGWKGQLLLVDPSKSQAGCYQCVFDEANDTSGSCSTIGVSGAMVGVVASFQANEALRYLLKLPSSLAQSLILIDGETLAMQTLCRSRRSDCPVCT